jgi:hypothetical protein
MSAASFGQADDQSSPGSSTSNIAPKEQNSSTPNTPTEEKKKGRFNLKRGFSGSKSKD